MPGVVVVHENRGLNPYIEDVVRRVAVAGFVGLGPDGLTPLGGYSGTDEEGREMQRQLDRGKLFEDFVAAYQHLRAHDAVTNKVGVVGFCYGGGVFNGMAVRLPELAASAPFYGGQPVARPAAIPSLSADPKKFIDDRCGSKPVLVDLTQQRRLTEVERTSRSRKRT